MAGIRVIYAMITNLPRFFVPYFPHLLQSCLFIDYPLSGHKNGPIDGDLPCCFKLVSTIVARDFPYNHIEISRMWVLPL